MTVFDDYFPLGLGTSRFPVSGPNDTTGIEKSIELARYALDCGVNYIDTSYTYSAGMAQAILREAFVGVKKPFGVTVKVMHDMDKTADAARRRVELQLKAMGLDRAAFFLCWTIFHYDIFTDIMRKGGIYEGARRLKDDGLVDHICFSTHAQTDDILRIIKSRAFEGVTISYSMLNALQMRPVLDAALDYNVGVAVMNPLGGGLIAQNQDFFAFSRSADEDSTITAAMRFVKAHPAVKIVLSGVNSREELNENLRAFKESSTEPDEARLVRVGDYVRELRDFCTGCNYCDGCHAKIPVSEIMKKRNALLFPPTEAYNRTEPELVRNIKLFYAHISANEWFPDSDENPCLRCGQCEAKCTQKLKIIDSIADMYNSAGRVGFTRETRRARIKELLVGKGFSKVGIYPNGGFSNLIVEMYDKYFGRPDFEWLQFNSDPKMWGETLGGLPVHSPNDIMTLRPDVIIVCTYRYDNEIYEDLKHYEDEGISVIKLHRETDVPWVF
jgi:predicted aldo/keto reductase-like oxidoreductase